MRKFGLVIILICVVGILFVGYGFFKPESSSKEMIFFGNVDIREVMLGFRVPGRIDVMTFDEGDHVGKGEAMAQLEQSVYREDLALSQAQFNEVKAAFNNASRVFKRRSKLIHTGAVSQALYEQAEASYMQTKAQVQTAKVRIDKAQTALDDTVIKAPVSGYILTRVREPGAVVGQGQTVYALTVDDPVWVRAYINETRLGLIRPGQKVKVYTDSRPKHTYHGQIGYIASQAEFTPKTVETSQLRTDLVYRFRVVIDNADNSLRQGMPVTVKINPIQDES